MTAMHALNGSEDLCDANRGRGFGAIGRAGPPARGRHARVAFVRCHPRRGEGARLAGEEGIECPVVELPECPSTPTSRSVRAGGHDREDLPADAEAGKQVMVLSCGALLPRPDLIELAKDNGGRIMVRPARCSASTRSRPRPKAPSIR